MKIKIHPSFLLYLGTIALFSSVWAALGMVVALCVHELSHYAVSTFVGEDINQVELTPFGGMMTYEVGKSPSKGLRGILVAAAGPAGNYLTILLATSGIVTDMLGSEAIRQLVMANAAMMAVNLLPALPLDGGRILFCAGYYFFGVSVFITWLTGMGVLIGIGFVLLGIYGAVRMQVLNLSMLIVGAYLMICAVKCRGNLLAENLYAVVQERQTPTQHIAQMRLYRVPGNTSLYALMDAMERTGAAVFVYEDEQGEHWVSERQICQALLQQPTARIDTLSAQSAPSWKKDGKE